MAFSPDGKWLAWSAWNSPFKVWDTTTGQEIGGTFEGGDFGVAFSPVGKWLASFGPDGTVKLWDVATGHEFVHSQGHTDLVSSVAFSPDAQWLASASRDRTGEGLGRRDRSAPPHSHGACRQDL